MNIFTAVEENPALILLQRTIQGQRLNLPSPLIQQQSDSVTISGTAKQLAKTAASIPS